jgi:dihydrofolate synthase/folylpolyglutamate synthase
VLVLEVGLGGRLDAVNLFDADVAIVTSIALDHQQWLGETREQIADEKIGIARSVAPIISSDVDSHELLVPRAQAVGAQAWRAQREYCFERCAAMVGVKVDIDHSNERWHYHGNALDFDSLPLPALAGIHQLYNAAAAITALSLLDGVQLTHELTAQSMCNARLPGRLQTLQGPPFRVVDVAHNPHAARALARWAEHHLDKPISAVCAMYADKDSEGTLRELSQVVQSWHFAPLPSPRGATAQQLMEELRRHAEVVPARSYDSVEQAWRTACRDAMQAGTALGFGSFDTVGEILRLERAASAVDT